MWVCLEWIYKQQKKFRRLTTLQEKLVLSIVTVIMASTNQGGGAINMVQLAHPLPKNNPKVQEEHRCLAHFTGALPITVNRWPLSAESGFVKVTFEKVERRLKVECRRQEGVWFVCVWVEFMLGAVCASFACTRRTFAGLLWLASRRFTRTPCRRATATPRRGFLWKRYCQLKKASLVIQVGTRAAREPLASRAKEAVLELLILRPEPLPGSRVHHFGDDVGLPFAPLDQTGQLVVLRLSVNCSRLFHQWQLSMTQVIENRGEVRAIAVDEISPARVAFHGVPSTEHRRQHAGRVRR